MKKTILLLCAVLLAAFMVCSCATAKTGAPITEYMIVFEDNPSGRQGNCARALQTTLWKSTGTKLESVAVSSGRGQQFEILIGNTGRQESIDATADFQSPMDYVIKTTKNKVVIVGYTPYATAAATDKYIQLITEDPKILKNGSFSYVYHFDTSRFNPMIYDASQFTPMWSAFYQAPDWMVYDYYESLYAVCMKGGRMSGMAHRGDFVYYPQTSLEAMASAFMAGADLVEFDFRLTKDNIPILMHDEDLRINTNCASKMGRNGLPNSYLVGDWTYDELMQLNMVKKDGTNTKYKVCTVYEALLVAKQFGAQVSWDDKADETTKPVFAATSTTSFEDMLPMMNYTDTLQLFYHYYSYFYFDKKTNYSFWESVPGTTDTYKATLPFWKKLLSEAFTKYYAIDGAWAYWNGDVRYKAWGVDKQMENDRYFSIWYEEGKNQIWTNCCVALAQYISNTFEPDDYSYLMK